MTTAAVEAKQQRAAGQPGALLPALAVEPSAAAATATTSPGLVPPLEALLAAGRASLLRPQAFFVSWQVGRGSWAGALGCSGAVCRWLHYCRCQHNNPLCFSALPMAAAGSAHASIQVGRTGTAAQHDLSSPSLLPCTLRSRSHSLQCDCPAMSTARCIGRGGCSVLPAVFSCPVMLQPPQPCACSGFTEALVELKQRITAAHPTLPPENPGKRPGVQACGCPPAAPLPGSGMPAAYAGAFRLPRC